jgi:hypothetical protein
VLDCGLLEEPLERLLPLSRGAELRTILLGHAVQPV